MTARQNAGAHESPHPVCIRTLGMVFTSPKSDKMLMFVQYVLTRDKCKYKARKLNTVRDFIAEVESLY